MPKLYLAGPMTGYAGHNFPAFRDAERNLIAAGHVVLSPAANPYGQAPWADYLRRDLRMVLDADAVAVLPGWETSRGARLEVRTAQALGMDVRTVAAWLSGGAGGPVPVIPEMPTSNEVGEWITHNFGPSEVRDQVLVVAEEVGELCRALVKREQGIRGSHAEWSAALRKEASDVVIALLAVAYIEGFDLPAEVERVWREVSSRDFVANPLGHGAPV